MSIAPEPILRAGNYAVSRACIYCRNQSLGNSIPAKMVNELMEAIHEVPRMLVDWDRHNLTELRTHLGCFRASQWPGAPDLVSTFDFKLKEFGYEDPPA